MFEGNEYIAGSKLGGEGRSFSYNIVKFTGSDFATKETYGDLLDLYSKLHDISMYDALLKTGGTNGFHNPSQVSQPSQPRISPPPRKLLSTNEELPERFRNGAKAAHEYFNETGARVGYVLRFETEEGKKFHQYSWDGTKWVAKAMPEPRPLYGLFDLVTRKDLPVLLVEGEKCADAAMILRGRASVAISWPGGSQAIRKVDWQPLYGREIILWPDNDDAGFKAMLEIGKTLLPHCPKIRVIDPSSQPHKWDIADALDAGLKDKALTDWMRAHIQDFKTLMEEPELEVLPAEQEEPPHPADAGEDLQDLRGNQFRDEHALAKPVIVDGKIVLNLDNMMRFMASDPFLKDVIWYDEFYADYLTKWDSDLPRPWKSTDFLALTLYFQNRLGLLKVKNDIVRDAAILYGIRNIKNEPKEWMETLIWDGTHRCEEFLIKAFQTKDTAYTRSISKNFWTAIAARTYSPGCKFDNMLVLESGQGFKKQLAIQAIGGRWAGTVSESVLTKDFAIALQGKLVIEMPELSALGKADQSAIKNMLSLPVDNFRPPYAEKNQNFPRRCVLIGTTNESEYLKDPSGGRRFWPVKIHETNLDYIKENREQLFAEAVAMFKSGSSWWEVPESETLEEQTQRSESDAWKKEIEEYLMSRGLQDHFTVSEIAINALKFDISRLDNRAQSRIRNVLSSLNYERGYAKDGGITTRVWRKPLGAPPCVLKL